MVDTTHIRTTHDICAGHSGHFYNCENGHTFVITEVRDMFSDSQRCINLLFVVWWCHGGFYVPRVSSTNRRWQSSASCL